MSARKGLSPLARCAIYILAMVAKLTASVGFLGAFSELTAPGPCIENVSRQSAKVRRQNQKVQEIPCMYQVIPPSFMHPWKLQYGRCTRDPSCGGERDATI
jgi:hypothetical protein